MTKIEDTVGRISLVADTKPYDVDVLTDLFDATRLWYEQDKAAYPAVLKLRERLTAALRAGIGVKELTTVYDLLKRSYLLTARDNFSDFMFYIEWNRKPEQRFYQPRMKYLAPMVQGYQEVLDGKLDLLTVSQPKRTGKALTLDTPLLTPNGWVKMGDVRVGDTLIGADGKPTTVTAVFPQGVVPVYDVKFNTGETIKTCANHLWLVLDENRTSHIMTTAQIMEKDEPFFVPMMKPAETICGESIYARECRLGMLLDGKIKIQKDRFLVYGATDEICFLARSLGGFVVKETDECVGIRMPDGAISEWIKAQNGNFRPMPEEEREFFIVSIRPNGSAPAQCICVDNKDHLFVCGESMIPTHNTQVEINFVNMISGKHPERASLVEGAGDALVTSFYKGCLEYLQDPQYLYYDVFPDAKLVQTNADMKTLNLERISRFPTIMCRSIDATQVGLSEATNLLVLDDTVLGREEATNRELLDKKWDVIRGDVLGRRIEGTPIIATGTRYSLYDPIGHLQEEAAQLGWRWRAVEIPALDPVTDESNYEHVRDGKKVFTTAYFRNERELLSKEQWESEFQQQPFEAKGRVFPEESLQRFFKLPPDKDPDAILAVCDTKEKGADYVMLPVGYLYGEDVFIVDCVYDDAGPEFTKPKCANMLVKHKVARATFEANNAGEYYARDVEKMVSELGGNTSIRLKRSLSNKVTRIITSSDGVLKHFWFLDKSLYAPQSDYGKMMKALTTFTSSGKNIHDDAPDGIAMLENETRSLNVGKCTVVARPW